MSIGYRRVNLDGSRNVSCIYCREFISTVSAMTPINSATCAVCQAGFDGIDLTEEQKRELRSGGRIDGMVVSQNVAYPHPIEDPIVQAHKASNPEEIDLKTNQLGYYVKALVFSIRDTVIEATKKIVPESKKLAREKKRSRVFSDGFDDLDNPEIFEKGQIKKKIKNEE